MASRKRQPQWWQLYVALTLLTGLFLPETKAVLTETEHVIAELGILFLIFAATQLWMRANRSALLHLDEEEDHLAIHAGGSVLAQGSALQMMEHRPSGPPMLQLRAPETSHVLSDTFQWDLLEDDSSVQVDRHAVSRKE
jgi:hypothetical protein